MLFIPIFQPIRNGSAPSALKGQAALDNDGLPPEEVQALLQVTSSPPKDRGPFCRKIEPVCPMGAALVLATEGYAVFPCLPDKRPATPRGFKNASTNPEIVRELWSKFPGPLVGVVTGSVSGTAVLDIDAKHPEARQWWIEHRDQLLPTLTHRTRSGGLHLVFRHREGLSCSASRIARGVDVRADGGYVIWWPAAGMQVLSESAPERWPTWLDEVLAQPPSPQPPSPPLAPSWSPPSSRRRLRGILRTVAEAPVGRRNGLLYWGAHRLQELLVAGGINEAAFGDLLAAAQKAGLPHSEIVRAIASARRAA